VITSFYRSPDGGVGRDLAPEEMAAAVGRPGGLLWVDLEAPDAAETRSILEGVFGFHQLAEDPL